MSGVNSQLNTFPAQNSSDPSTPGSPAFTVKFWGVRGHIPISSPQTSHYGGNTPCVELSVGGKCLIFDGGTGLRLLGEQLCDRTPLEAHVFFTHTRWDRIQGFPFFRPAFQEANHLCIYGPQSTNGASIKHSLSEQMTRPRFPVPFHHMKAQMEFRTVSAGQQVELGEVLIETIALNSDNLALGYRVSWNDYSVVYATDRYGAASQQGLQYLAKQADLLIFDAVQSGDTYYEAESLDRLRLISTWKPSLELAADLDAKQVIIFYHDPNHEDAFLQQIEREMQAMYPHVQMAQEGCILEVGNSSCG